MEAVRRWVRIFSGIAHACPEMAAEKHVMYMKTLIYLVFLRSEQPTCIISQFIGFIY